MAFLLAKLNVVIPNNEVTIRTESGGTVIYRKVDREVREGDVVQANEGAFDVTYGGFYAVDRVDGGYFVFTDDEGDERSREVGDPDFVVYEKVAPQPADELFTYEGLQYRKVNRKANAGEKILITEKVDNAMRDMTVGGVYKVLRQGTNKSEPPYVNVIDNVGDEASASDIGYVVLEPVNSDSPRRLTVGDYAKVVGNRNASNYTVGSVVKITSDDGTEWSPYKAEKIDGTVGNWLCLDDVEAATEADFLAQKYDNITQDGVTYRRAKEGEKPTHFIRKPGAHIRKTVLPDKVYKIIDFDSDGDYVCKGEYGDNNVSVIGISIGLVVAEPTLKVGDSVKLTIADGAKPHFGWGSVENGDIGKVAAIDGDRVVVDFPTQLSWNAKPAELTVVSDEVAKWAKIGREVGEYKAGDVVQLTRNTGSQYYRSGSIAILDSVNGDRVGFGGGYGGHTSWLKLVAPVEQRFDRGEASEVSAE